MMIQIVVTFFFLAANHPVGCEDSGGGVKGGGDEGVKNNKGGQSQTFLVICVTMVVTGLLILLMIIFALLVIQRRSTKVCYVQRSPEVLYTDRNKNTTLKNNMAHFYDDSFLDNVTLSRWQQQKRGGEMRANTPSIKSTASSNVIHLDITDGLRTGLKRPSNGTILPVTYLGVLPEEAGGGFGVNSDRRHSSPGVQEYVCY